MELLSIPLDQITIDPANVRLIDDEDVTGLAASIQAVGLLQPVVVRAITLGSRDEGWLLLAGKRRVKALRTLGRTHVAALEYFPNEDAQSYAAAASAAENMARKAMHPVDQWRAIAGLVDNGSYTIEGAAEALGLERRLGKRLSWLGHMAPTVLDALAGEPQLPKSTELRTIALAPHEVQAKALQQAQASRGKSEALDWWQVSQRCQKTRISSQVAIFSTDASGVVFDEDLFAEPDSREQFTTADIEGFLRAQTAALALRVEASKGRMLFTKVTDQHGTLAAPPGYTLTYDPVPKRWRVADKRKLVVAVIPAGYHVGEIAERVVVPNPERERAQQQAVQQPDEGVQPQRAVREPVTKAAQSLLAGMKTEALHSAARAVAVEWAEADNWPDLVRLLLMTFMADNLSVNTSSVDYGRHRLSHMADRLINPGGDIKHLSLGEIGELVADVIGGVIRFDHPNTNFGTSGVAAEWIGDMVSAENHMPRCDTEEVLRGFNGEKLADIAAEQGIDPSGKVGELRKRMIGKMPDWRPVTFGAALGDVAEDAQDDETEE